MTNVWPKAISTVAWGSAPGIDLAETKQDGERDTLRPRAGSRYRQEVGKLEGLSRLKVEQWISQLGGEIPKPKASEFAGCG